LQSNVDLFETLGSDILYVAQLERDPALLLRIKNFVQHDFPVVCDPNQISREAFPLFTAYIIDRNGILRTRIPGTLSARPNLDMILKELCKVAGVPRIHPRPRGQTPTRSHEPGTVVRAEDVLDVLWMWLRAEDVLDVLWMWSHDRIAPGDRFKLAFLPTLAPGFHVYAPQESRMTPFAIEFSLPTGIAWAEALRYPIPATQRDPFLEVDVLQYAGDIPLPALEFKATEHLVPGQYQITATVSYQACNDSLCYPPAQKTVTLPLEVVDGDTPRNQVAGWEKW
jgi:hypothetical protein